jgi:hypothetical protein
MSMNSGNGSCSTASGIGPPPGEEDIVPPVSTFRALQVYLNSRGKELPGNDHHILLHELFHVQTGRWHETARKHLKNLHTEIEEYVGAALYLVSHMARMIKFWPNS